MKPIKFVIVSVARSGTSHIISMLRKTKGFFAHGEVFHPDIPTHILEPFLSNMDLGVRERDPIVFVNSLLDHAPNPLISAVGFKMWYDQSPEVCEYILANAEIAKVIVERPNRLASYSSEQKAQATGIWNIEAHDHLDESYAEQRLLFRPGPFLNYVKYVDLLFLRYREKARGPVIDISYDDILNRTAYSKLMTFLHDGVEASHGASREPEGLKRLNRSSVLSRFAEPTFPAVVDTLDRIGHPEWAFEGIEATPADLPQRAERIATTLADLASQRASFSSGLASKEAIACALERVIKPDDKINILLGRVDALLEERRQICEARAKETEAADLARSARERAESETRTIAQDLEALRRQLAEVVSAKADLETEARGVLANCAAVLKELDDVNDQLQAVLESRSWRAMEPVRRFTAFVRSRYHALRRGAREVSTRPDPPNGQRAAQTKTASWL